MWVWIAIGLGSVLGLSLLVGFVLARILGTIGRQISELYETEDWAALPLTRSSKAVEEPHAEEIEAKSSHPGRRPLTRSRRRDGSG